MGTKNNPGKYDCYAKADPDEPLFTLRAKDPSAPYLVRMWAAVRQGNAAEAHKQLLDLLSDLDAYALVSKGGYEKLDEAKACAFEMYAWREERKAERVGKEAHAHVPTSTDESPDQAIGGPQIKEFWGGIPIVNLNDGKRRG